MSSSLSRTFFIPLLRELSTLSIKPNPLNLSNINAPAIISIKTVPKTIIVDTIFFINYLPYFFENNNVFSYALYNAEITAPLTPFDSNSASPSIVEPAGDVTLSFNTAGCISVL